MRILLRNSNHHEAIQLSRWLTPFGGVTLIENGEEVVERVARGELVDLVVVCVGDDRGGASRFHATVMSHHAEIAARIVYVCARPLPSSLTADGARVVCARAATPFTLSRHLGALAV